MKAALKLTEMTEAELAQAFDVELFFSPPPPESGAPRPPRFARPEDNVPVIFSLSAQPCMRNMRWGFVPYWTLPEDRAHPFPFAPLSEAHHHIPFRESFARRRCAVPARALERATVDENELQLFDNTGTPRAPKLFAGIWDVWVNAEGIRRVSFALVGQRLAPGEWLAHELPTREALRAWLEPGASPTQLKAKLELWNPEVLARAAAAGMRKAS